jgi:hypothetical protein
MRRTTEGTCVTDSDLLLPEGSRLLHIGPHKTGTTAVQRALQQRREVMAAEHGVLYPGVGPSHIRAAIAVVGAKGLVGAPPAAPKAWHRLVRETAEAPLPRVVISSEFFDMADDDTAERVVTELGGAAVHVVVTLRPLGKLLPSAWQQAVRARSRRDYTTWLDTLFTHPDQARSTTLFWQRHRHDVLIERWAKVTGPARLTVVVLDESDRLMLPRTFEALLGLPLDLLSTTTGSDNRSLSLSELALLRALNEEFRARDWSDEDYARFIRNGVVQNLQAARRPSPGEPAVSTPHWALERAASIGADMVPRIESVGARVIGDLSSLGRQPPPAASTPISAGDDDSNDVPVVPVEVALPAVVGAILAGMRDAPTT